MNSYTRQHLARAWSRHFILQMASVTVMTLVLVLLNFLFLGYAGFTRTLGQWGQSLEMIVYLKDGSTEEAISKIRSMVETSGQFEKVGFTEKAEATKRFLTALGPDSLELLKDPKWSSPIPASFELLLSSDLSVEQRVPAMQMWSAKLKGLEAVEDIFYGQGWIENFTKFIASARGVLFVVWILSLAVGLLIVSNCIRLSFAQRREEIEILELVGATSSFVRQPFLVEGLTLGILASILSLTLSFFFHSFFIYWLSKTWTFWAALDGLKAMDGRTILINIVTALAFGWLGAWNCVRRLNTGWSAAVK